MPPRHEKPDTFAKIFFSYQEMTLARFGPEVAQETRNGGL
jgi:hypothetical protein